MSQPLYPPSSPQSIGQVLDAAFRIFGASLVKCLPASALSMIAGQLPNIYLLARGRPIHEFGGADPVWWALYALGALLSLTFLAAMLIRQFAIVTQQPTRVRSELRQALLGAPALFGLVVASVVLIAVGLLAVVVPGLYLMTALMLAWPALLFERRSIPGAIRYSLHLARRNWWRMTAVLIVAVFTFVAFYIVVFALLGIALQVAGANDIAMFTAASVVVLIVLGAVGAPFSGALVLALYGDMKVRRDGTDLAGRLAGIAPG